MEGIVLLLLLGGGIWLLAKRDQLRKARLRRARSITALTEIAERAEREFRRLDELKTISAKINSCGRVSASLSEAEHYPECREVLKNYDELMARLRSMKKVLPIISNIEKAYKHQFKGELKRERGVLLDALYEIRMQGISDDDFLRARIYPEGTGEILEVANIERRLKKLGWTQEQS